MKTGTFICQANGVGAIVAIAIEVAFVAMVAMAASLETQEKGQGDGATQGPLGE